jgi:hypothetical protein
VWGSTPSSCPRAATGRCSAWSAWSSPGTAASPGSSWSTRWTTGWTRDRWPRSWPTRRSRSSCMPAARTLPCCGGSGGPRSGGCSTPRWPPGSPGSAPRPATAACWPTCSACAWPSRPASPAGTTGRSVPSSSPTPATTSPTCCGWPMPCRPGWRPPAGCSGRGRSAAAWRRPVTSATLGWSGSGCRVSPSSTRRPGRSRGSWRPGGSRPPPPRTAPWGPCAAPVVVVGPGAHPRPAALHPAPPGRRHPGRGGPRPGRRPAAR